jgi:hypothetical protein
VAAVSASVRARGRRDDLTTRRRAHVPSRRRSCSSATPMTCRSASPASWAASTPRSPTPRPRWRSRWRGSSRSDHADVVSGSGCVRRRRPASSAASTRTASTGAIARFVELLRETCPDLVVHAGAATPGPIICPPNTAVVQVRIGEVNRVLGTDLVADDLPRLLDPIGFTVSGSGDAHGGTAVVAPDSTEEIDVIEEVARHYGYDRLGKASRSRRCTASSVVRQQRRRRLREVLLGLGISEAMPNPFLAPDTLAKAGLDGSGDPDHQPTRRRGERAAHVAASGAAPRRCLQRVAPATGVALFEIGHVYPPGEGELPGEYEALTVVLAGQEAPSAMAVWREIAAALGAGARIDQSKVPAGLHATRSATLQAGREPLGAVGEVAPEVLAPSSRRTGRDRRADLDQMPRPRTQAGAVEADEPVSRRATSTSRSSLGGDRCRPRSRQGDPSGGGQPARRPRPVRRLPGRTRRGGNALARLSGAAPGVRSQPDRRRHRRCPPGRRGRDDQARCPAAKLR